MSRGSAALRRSLFPGRARLFEKIFEVGPFFFRRELNEMMIDADYAKFWS